MEHHHGIVKTTGWKTDTTLLSDRSTPDAVRDFRATLANRGYNAIRMRRSVSIAAFVAFLLALAVPVWAQHGGGGHGGGGGHAGGFGGGGHAGFGGGHSGGFTAHSGFSGSGHMHGGQGFGGSHLGTPHGFSHNFSSRANRGPFLHDGFRTFRHRRDRDFDNFTFRNCWGFGCRGYAYPGWGYYDPYWYDPYWFWRSDSSYDDSYYQNLAEAREMNRESLEEQRMRRQEEADGDQDIYPQPHHDVSSPASGEEKKGAPMLPSTILVFRDQHKQEIENYAIVGQTLYNFQPQHTEKIALSSLDLPATAKANDDRGMKFSLPQAQ
jgi:hypothetical protein